MSAAVQIHGNAASIAVMKLEDYEAELLEREHITGASADLTALLGGTRAALASFKRAGIYVQPAWERHCAALDQIGARR